MLLTTIMRTGKENEYLFHFLVPRRDGSIDVTGKGLSAEKVPYFRAVWHLGISAGETA